MRKNYSSKNKKIFQHPPPPPPNSTPQIFFLHKFFFLNVGNSMKREENMKFFKFYFFKYLKNS